MKGKYDFGGWATKNNLRCADGRIIRKDAFKVQDGCEVPLVWNHQHNSPEDVLGHAILENREEGVYAYCSFNNGVKATAAKESVLHGDVKSLSIWANNLDQVGPEVLHGVIREVSLVLAGANPGAFVESVLAHGEPLDESDTEGILYTGEGLYLAHAEEEKKEEVKDEKNAEKGTESEKTIGDIIDAMTDEQQNAVYALVGMAIKDARTKDDDEDEEKEVEGKEMKHNIFENKNEPDNTKVLSHSDMEAIFADARRLGSLKASVEQHLEGGVLMHAVPTEGMDTPTGTQNYGFNDPSMLFPDYRSLNTPPEWISRNMSWVEKVMSRVHKTPFTRIKSLYANITEDEARARGYIKGRQKKEEVFTTLKRTTDPQTIYKLQKLDRDDILDITDFDVVAWLKAEMRVMLREELARAILIGDGRPSDAEDKIKEIHIRPIAKDVPLFNTVVQVPAATDADGSVKNVINAIIRARKNYKGSGSPAFFTTEDLITEMLLLEDNIGHKLYKTEAELATALRVSEIIPVEPMEGQKIPVGGTDMNLLGVIVNMADYNLGNDRNGEESMFDDFDIDYNQQKYLIETRRSGALTKPFSALTIVQAPSGSVGA